MSEPDQAALVARECSFCQRTARWVVEGDLHAFRAWACGPHAHRALGLGQNNPDHLYAGGGDASRWPQRGASSAPCFCGHPDDRERVHRAHACEPWTQRGARS